MNSMKTSTKPSKTSALRTAGSKTRRVNVEGGEFKGRSHRNGGIRVRVLRDALVTE